MTRQYNGTHDFTNASVLGAGGFPLASLAGSTFSTIQDTVDTLQSSGCITGGVLANPGGANITVTSGTGFIRATDSETAELSFFDWPALGSTAIPTDTTRFIGVEFNAGSPQVTIRTSDDFDNRTDFILGIAVNEADVLFISNSVHRVGDHVNSMLQRSHEALGIQRDNVGGGIILSELGTRNLAVSAGALWDRLSRTTVAALDTSVADTFDRYFRDGVGGFTKQTAETQWDNTQFDDGTGTLDTLANNRFANQWFYIQLDGSFMSMYGTAEHANAADAEAEKPPSDVPDRINNLGLLIGRIIFQESAATGTIESAFITSFTGAIVTDHGSLGGLSDDDHPQYSLISSQVGIPSSTPTRVGEINVDTTADAVFISTDTASSADWSIVTNLLAGNVADSSAVVNTTTETTFDVNFSAPTNFLTVGKVLRMTVSGDADSDTVGPGDNLTLRLKIGATTILTSAAINVDNLNSKDWTADIVLITRTTGATGTMTAHGVLGEVGSAAKVITGSAVTIDTTAANTIGISGQWDGAGVNITTKLINFTLEALN